MPPATLRAFGFETVDAEYFDDCEIAKENKAAIDSHGVTAGVDKLYEEQLKKAKIEASGKDAHIYKG